MSFGYSFESVFVLINGARQTPVVPFPGLSKPIQPVDLRVLKFAQVLGFYAVTQNPQTLLERQVIGFRVEFNDPAGPNTRQRILGFRVGAD